ncbi:hypothetical protein [Stutzerimonas azotifigens]|nr:hypothetical protein [Stutzerimonas azotifigens]
MPKDTPASIDREVVSPEGADDEPTEPVPPSVPANTAPEIGEPDRPEQ